jgi:integral membrane protein (TIGR00529 family)
MNAGFGFLMIVISIIIILVLPRFKINIAIAIMAGALFLLFALGAQWDKVLLELLNWHGFWRIIVIVFLSLLIVALMEKIGYLDMMVKSVKALASSLGSSMVSISAFIGLLPMPGGAYVSARLVTPLTKEMKLNPVEATSLNYWFRHLWEYWWPLYTGVIVASAILEVSIPDFVIHMFFLTILAVFAGYIFVYYPIMRKKNIKKKRVENGKSKEFGRLLYSSWPIIAVMILTLLGLPWSENGKIILHRVDLFYSLLSVDILLLIILLTHKKYEDAKYSLKFALKPTFLGVTFAALFMKIAVIETNSMFYTYQFFNMYGIPPFVVIIILPYLAGLMTGVTVAYVAATFPLILPYIGSPPNFAAIALAYASGYAGHLSSPVHLCLVLSAKHFKADIYKVIKRVSPAIIFVVAVVLTIYLI